MENKQDIKSIKNWIPLFVQKKIHNLLRKVIYPNWYEQLLIKRKEIDSLIPRYNLELKHIEHLTPLLNRTELLKKMPANAICAEIGVDQGEFSKEILNITTPKKLHLIDAWGDETRYHDGLKLKVTNAFQEQIAKEQIEVNVGLSTEVLNSFPDNYFDWVYLDTSHTYSETKKELKILSRKMKPNGIISGHDYIIGNWNAGFRYGVIEAVHEFCVQDNWGLKYITVNQAEMPSFAIKKLP